MVYMLDVPQYGPVEVHEDTRCKRLTLKFYDGGRRLRMSVPPRTTPKFILEFFKNYAEAIGNVAKKATERSQYTDFTPDTVFHTRKHELAFKIDPKGRLLGQVSADKATVFYPEGTDFTDKKIQGFIRKVIDAALMQEAKEYLPGRLSELAAANGLKYHTIDIRNTHSQWGSCSTKGRICLNSQLMRLPDDLIDLVLLHELTHTIHMDHSPSFYADLDRFLGGRHDELNKRLKKIHIEY